VIIDAFLKSMGLAQALYMLSYRSERKEVRTMKIAKSFLAGLLLVGSFGTSGALAAAPGVITNATLTPGSYCHLTFPAIDEETLSWNRPVLKDPSEGDIIDFYGPCDHDPLGADEIQSQKDQRARELGRDGE
jgi:hypothetical protein